MRALLLLLAACGADEPGPHDEVPCDPSWGLAMPVACERACQAFPDAEPITCPKVSRCLEPATFEGVVGCCKLEGTVSTGLVARWTECE